MIVPLRLVQVCAAHCQCDHSWPALIKMWLYFIAVIVCMEEILFHYWCEIFCSWFCIHFFLLGSRTTTAQLGTWTKLTPKGGSFLSCGLYYAVLTRSERYSCCVLIVMGDIYWSKVVSLKVLVWNLQVELEICFHQLFKQCCHACCPLQLPLEILRERTVGNASRQATFPDISPVNLFSSNIHCCIFCCEGPEGLAREENSARVHCPSSPERTWIL